MSSTSHSAMFPARQRAKATVALISGPESPVLAAPEDLKRWRQLTPSAMWALVGLTKVSRTTIVDSLVALMDRRALQSAQLILLGSGDAGRCAFELVLQGAIDCAGIVAVDIPCDPVSFRLVSEAAAIRLVIHQNDSKPTEHGLLKQLQRADIDVRVIGLCATANRSATIANAAETFLLELVALVARQGGNGV
jgi:hypothetical protein